MEMRSGWQWKQAGIGLNNGLAPNVRQAIIRNDDGKIYFQMYLSRGLDVVIMLWNTCFE